MKGFEFTIVGRVEASSMDDARYAVAKVVRQLDNYRDDAGNLITDCGYDVRFFQPADHMLDEAGRTTLTGGVHELAERTEHDRPELPPAGGDRVGDPQDH